MIRPAGGRGNVRSRKAAGARIVIRTDASVDIGTGHVMRCRALAGELSRRGATARFCCRAHPGHLGDLLAADGFEVTMFPGPARRGAPPGDDYAAWLGASQSGDAQATIAALEGTTADWLVVDHYGLDAGWERALRPHVGRLAAIDDLANREHDVDMLLDQNYAADPEGRYRDRVREGCPLLLGPRYALLSPDYARWHGEVRDCDGAELRSVLVYFGGTDAADATSLALDALSHRDLASLPVSVVAGTSNPRRAALEERARARGRTTVHGPCHSLARFMAKAGLGIGAGGTTTWERLCLGLPSVVVSVAENQRPACEALARDGLISYVGRVDETDVDALADAARRLVIDRERRRDMSRSGRALVDGLGASRVADVMLGSASGASHGPGRSQEIRV